MPESTDSISSSISSDFLEIVGAEAPTTILEAETWICLGLWDELYPTGMGEMGRDHGTCSKPQIKCS